MLIVHTKNFGNAIVLCLQGQIVNGETEILTQAFDSISEPNAVILDLARVTIIDAHGLGVLLELRERAQVKGVRFKLMNVPRLIKHVLAISHLDSVFQITSQIKYVPLVSSRRRTSVAA